MNTVIIDALKTYDAAMHNLWEAVKTQYPVDDIVDVKFGEQIVRVRIRGHTRGPRPYPKIHGVNTATGKRRYFYHTQVM